MNKTFDFREALACLEADIPVCITINGTERKYFMKDGVLMCTPNNKDYLTYIVKSIYTDVIMSKNWKVYE